MHKDRFPIETATACQFKWTWSTIFLSLSSTTSCHRCKQWDITPETFKDFHNHPGKIKDREKMLDGLWPGNGCEYCKVIEDTGEKSERTSYINDSLLSPPELQDDPTATSVTPRLLEVYFSNLCNQSCTYCGPIFSSKIDAELRKYGPLNNQYGMDKPFEASEDYQSLKSEFWKWMNENSQHLYFFQVLGGEPLYQPEFEECMEFFRNKAHPNLVWKIFTNLKHHTGKLDKRFAEMEDLITSGQLKGIEMVCSNDCWGPEAEYARHGMKQKQWSDNFELLLKRKLINISVHSTLSCLTLPTAYELTDNIKLLNAEFRPTKADKPVTQGWNIIVDPPILDPVNFGGLLNEYFDKLIESAPVKDEYLIGFAEKIATARSNAQQLTMLRNYLDELDRRRNLDWRKIYPWMDEIFKKEIIDLTNL